MKNLKKNLFGIGLAFSMMLGVGFSLAPERALANEPGEGCENKPDENNGDCTYSTNAEGVKTYFCENSVWFHDCVK